MSGREGGDEPPEGSSAPPPRGGPAINGSIEAMLTPELLYKMNKKIAQLTKVVYGLNTRGEELEAQLSASKEAEESLRTTNTELQHRANHYKTKLEAEIAHHRDVEAQAGQAHYWKMECEALKRRLENESLSNGSVNLMGGEGARAAVLAAREETERALRREKAAQYELEQARIAIANLKSHHDFIMRERDAQQAMENEKVILEWQTQMADVESRYKSQVRRVQDDFEVLTAEADLLRRRVQQQQQQQQGQGQQKVVDQGVLREQFRVLQMEKEREKREMEAKVRSKQQEVDDGLLRHNQERRDLEQRIRTLTEERRVERGEFEDRLSKSLKDYETQLKEATDKRDLMQRLIDDKEEEFESRLKVKVVEWKSEWDAVEEGLRAEILKLKDENGNLRSEANASRGRLDRAGIEYENRIQELEVELRAKNNDLQIKSQELKVRIGAMESENKQQSTERTDLEKRVKEERDKYRQLLTKYEDLNGRVRVELENKVKELTEKEWNVRKEKMEVAQENQTLKVNVEEFQKKLQDTEAEWKGKMDKELKNSEGKIKQRIEKMWLEKVRRSEETAAQDIERLKEAHRKSEAELRKEIDAARKSDEEAKRLNEEFKKKIRQMRRSEEEAATKLSEVEERLNELQSREETWQDTNKKELAAQEERYQKQVDQLTIALAEKQENVSQMQKKIEELKQVREQVAVSEETQKRLDDLGSEVKIKTDAIDTLTTELQYTRNEAELTKNKLQQVEGELEETRTSNSQLQTQLNQAAKAEKMEELESRISKLEEQLKEAEEEKQKLEKNLSEIELEREEEIKIIQDALDEAAQEREELITTFEKEMQNVNTINTSREQQLLEDFEWKLREMEKEHKKKMDEKERMCEQSTLHRAKRAADDVENEFRHKIEKMKNELNAEWEDKLRSECSRLKGELDDLHSEEKHLAVESMKVQKEQEIQTLKQSWELKQEEMTKEISTLKDSLTDKDAYYHKELETQRTNADRDIWELRRKLIKLDETSYNQQEYLTEKHRDEMERLRSEYEQRVSDLEATLASQQNHRYVESKWEIEKMYKDQMEHLGQQHRLSMERLREELEAEKFQAVEEARVILARHNESIIQTLREQLTEAVTGNTQYREELDAIRLALSRREEVIRTLEDEVNKIRNSSGNAGVSSASAASSAFSASQYSLASSTQDDSRSSQGSSNSQDRLSIGDDGQDDAHKAGSGASSLLGKMFGGGWFGGSKTKDVRRGSAPCKQSP